MGKLVASSETTNLSIRIDKELKRQADQLFADIGMNITTAFTIFIKQALREGGIPFNINVNTGIDAHRQYILAELGKAKKEALSPVAIWHSEEDVLKMLEETI